MDQLTHKAMKMIQGFVEVFFPLYKSKNIISMKSDIRLFLSIPGMLVNVTATLWIINVKLQPYVLVYATRPTHKHIKLDSGDITYS